MTTSPAGDKLPNVNGLRDAKPRHSLGYRVQHRARTIVASVIAAMLVFSGTAAAATWLDVNGIIKDHSVEIIGQGSLDANTSIIDPNSGKPIEFVLIGQDSRDGEENQSVGGNFDDVVGNHQADTTMVAQISADRTKINLVSIPRDSLVDIPQCETTNGTIPAQYNVMFNSIFANAYQTGGDLASAQAAPECSEQPHRTEHSKLHRRGFRRTGQNDQCRRAESTCASHRTSTTPTPACNSPRACTIWTDTRQRSTHEPAMVWETDPTHHEQPDSNTSSNS